MVSPTDIYSITHNIGKINIWINSASNVLVYEDVGNLYPGIKFECIADRSLKFQVF